MEGIRYGLFQDVYRLPDGKMEAGFVFNDTVVTAKSGELRLTSIKKLDAIDGVIEMARYVRPDLLIIQGILSFFAGTVFTVYEKIRDRKQVLPKEIKISKKYNRFLLTINGIDHSNDLRRVLEVLNGPSSDRSLLITLLDRWRKAIYMDFESEVDTYHDEAILTHFHILELLVGEYYEGFKVESNTEIRAFLQRFASDFLNQRGRHLEETVNKKFNVLKEVLVSDEASVATKLNYFLKKYNLLDDQTYSLVNKLVKIRNAIAHGRITYRGKLIWPLPPFFNLTNESHVITSQISIFTARAIALHFGLKAWEEEWGEVHEGLYPSDETILSFVKDEEERALCSPQSLLSGKHKHITVESIVDMYIFNRRKLTLSDMEHVLFKVIKEIQVSENNSHKLFFASVLLSDSADPSISQIAQDNVKKIHNNNWLDYSNIKDIVRYFDFHGIHVKWLSSLIEEGGHYQTRLENIKGTTSD